MNWKTFAIRLAGLIVISLAMFPLYGLTMNILLFLELIPSDLIDKAAGSVITMKAMYVWIACLFLGFGSIFIKGDWRYILYLSPLYAPCVFAVIYTLLQ